jgi:hypothetical protein
LSELREKNIYSSLIFILKLKKISLKNFCAQFLQGKVLISPKDERFLKFLIIGERKRTTANGGELLRTTAKARERLFTVVF